MADLDLVTLGRRIRHARKAAGLTLGALASAVDRAPSLLSQIENGRREPRLTLLQAIATALGVDVADLMKPEPPSHRAALEIALEHAQADPLYSSLGLPHVTAGPTMPADVLESLVGLHGELRRRATEQAATPEEARRANAELRRQMRDRGNYFAETEQVAAGISRAVGHDGGPLTERGVGELTTHLGFTLHRVADLPRATRSITDLEDRRIYLPASGRGGHDPRTIVLQTLGHFALGHREPADYADFLRQRVETNYFAAALLMPEAAAADFLQRAKARRELAIDDLRDVFAVSYETAAHRFTNLATHHLGLPVHFMRVGEDGVIYKAYENDDVTFPADVTGAIEGQLVCRFWACPRGVRRARPLRHPPPVHRHGPRHVLVHHARREHARGRLRHRRRRAVRPLEVVPGPRDHRPGHVGLPRPVLLPPPAGRAGGPLEQPGLAQRAGPLAPPGSIASRHLSGGGRHRRLHLPGATLRSRIRLTGHSSGIW